MILNEEVINDIRESASISEVIGHYVPLFKKGRNYSAVCPFHDDHDPSLSISEEKKIFKCFVCGKGGNVFSFVSEYKNISFPQAVVEVSKIIGKPLDIEIDSRPKKVDPNQHFYDLMASYTAYGNYLLMASKKGIGARDYLNKRGLNDEVISRFEIGLNPEDDYMHKYLLSQHFSDQDMNSCNLIRINNYGVFDIFANRITFPIHDEYGNCIAVSARDYLGKSDSKYINTAETQIYRKGDILYNYHRAIDAIHKNKCVFVCEGVMDAIAFDRAGICNVVATLGTACSSRQYELLRDLNVTVVLAYDGDRAGINATVKLAERFLDQGIVCEVINNQTGKDPDEIVTLYGGHSLRDLASHRISYIEFLIAYYKQNFDLNNYSDRKEATIRISAAIDKLNDPYDIENYSRDLFELTRIRRISNNRPSVTKSVSRAPVYNSYVPDGITKAEYTILSQMALSKEAIDLYQRELGCMISSAAGLLALCIIDDQRRHGSVSFSRIFDETEDQSIRDLISDISVSEFISDTFSADILRGAIRKISDEILKEKLKDLQSKIKEIQLVDPIESAELLKEYAEVLKRLKE